MYPEFVQKFKIVPQTSDQVIRSNNALYNNGEIKPEIQKQIDLVLNTYKDPNTYYPEIEQAISVVFDLEVFELSDIIAFMRTITMNRVQITHSLYPWFSELMKECAGYVREARSVNL